jgi:hypothetical protein
MDTNEITPALRQLLVDAAAAMNDLTDDLGDEGDEARRLACRLLDAAAGRETVRRFLVEQDIGGGDYPVEVCEFQIVNGQIEVATDNGWESTLCAWTDPTDPESAARDAAEWVATGRHGIYDPDEPVIVTDIDCGGDE